MNTDLSLTPMLVQYLVGLRCLNRPRMSQRYAHLSQKRALEASNAAAFAVG
jgi:hypothetical protein